MITIELQKFGFVEDEIWGIHRASVAEECIHFIAHGGVALTSSWKIIEVSGDDACDFLHSQCSGDVNGVSLQHGQINSWCSAEGRAIANFYLLRVTDAVYWLVLRGDVAEYFIEKLSRFILCSKVTISCITEQFYLFGLLGRKAISSIHNTVLPIWQIQTHAQGITCRLPGKERYLSIVKRTAKAAWMEERFLGQNTVGNAAWSLSEILSGIPWIQMKTSGRFLPQFINLERLGGVSFTKGCFPGQQVIARLHYRGRIKKRLFIGHVSSPDTLLHVGQDILRRDSKGQIGEIINVAPPTELGSYFLAVAEKDQALQADHQVSGMPETTVSLRLPPEEKPS